MKEIGKWKTISEADGDGKVTLRSGLAVGLDDGVTVLYVVSEIITQFTGFRIVSVEEYETLQQQDSPLAQR